MTAPDDLGKGRLATRLSFFAAGFALAGWAPIIPFAKTNVGADDARLGLLLLCLGVGSILAMPVAGALSTRYGARPMTVAGGAGLVLLLPVLAVAGSPFLLAIALFGFGAALGAIEVAMAIHAVHVEKLSERPLMSGFHAMFSVGTIAGAGTVTVLLASGFSPFGSALTGSAMVLLVLVAATLRLLATPGEDGQVFALPRGVVLLLSLLTAVMFLVEGAVLDWGALLLIEKELTTVERSGLGYLLFSITMTLGRFAGDRVVAAIGYRNTLIGGGVVTIAGIAIILWANTTPLAVAGFAVVGLGASNLVPVLFSLAGRQTVMPVGIATAAVSTVGYAGILLGPAVIGFISQATSLTMAFGLLAGLVVTVPLSAATLVKRSQGSAGPAPGVSDNS